MHTAVVGIEAILNSRPHSYVSPDDFDEPSHLLAGCRILSLPGNLIATINWMAMRISK